MAPSRSRRRRAPVISLLLGGDQDGAPLYTRVYRQLREHILRGTLGPSARLPSARELAADLRLSRNTVEAAFMQLQAEGFIRRRIGAGTFVAETVPEATPWSRSGRGRRGGSAGRGSEPPAAGSRVDLSRRGQLIAGLGAREIERDRPLGACATDLSGFPAQTWNRLLARRARRAGSTVLATSDPAGVPALRRAIAEYVRLARGVHCESGQVLVVNSAQQALDLAARLLLDPGATAAMEEPGYPSARAALQAAGASVRPVPVDRDGLVASALPVDPEVRLLYTTPSHQFPLGVTMGLGRRLAVLRWAAAVGAWVIEDDYDSEFQYGGRPIAALQGLDTAGRTVYVGTFNKVLFPGLRLAYLIVPPALVDAFAAGRRILDGFSSPLLQSALADFIAEGHFTAHLRQARRRYAGCRDALVGGIATAWGDAVRLGPSDTGLHLAAHLPEGSDDVRIARAAPEGDVGVTPLSDYYHGGARRPGLLLSYGAATPEGIRRAVEGLAPHVVRTAGSARR